MLETVNAFIWGNLLLSLLLGTGLYYTVRMRGFQLRGIVTGFDPFVVVLESEGKQQVIYKHAISTVVPARPVELREEA